MCAEKIGSSLAPTKTMLLNDIKKMLTSASVRFRLGIGTQGAQVFSGVANVVLKPISLYSGSISTTNSKV